MSREKVCPHCGKNLSYGRLEEVFDPNGSKFPLIRYGVVCYNCGWEGWEYFEPNFLYQTGEE